jgi:hypothetical protein
VYIFSPSVANDEKWTVVLDQRGFLKRNRPLETFLKQHDRPDLLLLRDTPPGDEHSQKAIPVQSEKPRDLPPPQIVAMQTVKDEKGTYLNMKKQSVVEFPTKFQRAIPRGDRFVQDFDTEEVSKQWYRDFSERDNLFAKFEHAHDHDDFRNPTTTSGAQKQKEPASKIAPNGKITWYCVFDDNPDLLKRIMDNQQKIIDFMTEKKDQGFSKKTADRCLFIFDDLPGSELLSARKTADGFKKLMIRHRHLSASTIIVAQAYKCIVKVARVNISALCLFKIYNLEELKVIWEEYPMELDFETWMRMYTYATDDKYSFLFINLQNSKEQGQLFKNFTERLHYQPNNNNNNNNQKISETQNNPSKVKETPILKERSSPSSSDPRLAHKAQEAK